MKGNHPMSKLIIAPLSTPNSLTLAAKDAIEKADRLFLQTSKHPCAAWILSKGLPFTSMDDLYESCDDFDALNNAVAERLMRAGDAVFAVAGRSVGSALFSAILHRAEKTNTEVIRLPGSGYAESALAALDAPIGASGISIHAANAMDFEINPYLPLCIEEIDTQVRAGEVKLRLSEFYPDDHAAYFCVMDEDGAYFCRKIPLYELDRQSGYFAATTLILPAAGFASLTRYGMDGLIEVVDKLRDPGGCPWDREQTHESLRTALLEEAYEVLDAIDRQDEAALCEELGDLLLQIVFHAKLEAEKRAFTFRDVTSGIVNKLVSRHPHVFAKKKVDSVDEVLSNWEQLKKKEKHFGSQSEIMNAVPKCFPSLMRSAKVQKKAADVGFDWDDALTALEKVYEEADELKAAMLNGADPEGIDEELGDLLFSCVNVMRLLKRDGELILASATDKFIKRFQKMEEMIEKSGLDMRKMDLKSLDTYWNRTKT